jgi:hypothetical protein
MNPQDDPWRQEEQRLREQQYREQQPRLPKPVPNLMGCKLGAAGCFGLVVLFCLVAGTVHQATQTLQRQLNSVEEKLDKIDKKLEERRPEAEKLDVLPQKSDK